MSKKQQLYRTGMRQVAAVSLCFKHGLGESVIKSSISTSARDLQLLVEARHPSTNVLRLARSSAVAGCDTEISLSSSSGRSLRPTIVRVPRQGAGKGLRKLVLSGNRIGGVVAFARALRNVMTRSESPLEVRPSWALPLELWSRAVYITAGFPLFDVRAKHFGAMSDQARTSDHAGDFNRLPF